eukprot:11545925-Ditylum_brightwellii.AAC.1
MHGGIAWVVIDEIEDLMLDWSHLPQEQMNGKVLPPVWVGQPYMEWMEGVSEAEKQCNQMTRATLSMVDDM